MLKSTISNNSPGHSHNEHTFEVGLSSDICPGNISKRRNKMIPKWMTQNDVNERFLRNDKFKNEIRLDLKTKSFDELIEIVDQTNNSENSHSNTISDEFKMFEAMKELKRRNKNYKKTMKWLETVGK